MARKTLTKKFLNSAKKLFFTDSRPPVQERKSDKPNWLVVFLLGFVSSMR